MTTRYKTRIRPSYVSSGAINLGARAVRENGMSPGRITVRLEGRPEFAIEATLNKGHGLRGLGKLYKELSLEAGQVVHFEVVSPDTIIILHKDPSPLPPAAPIPKKRAKLSRKKSYRPLDNVHKQFIAVEITRLISVARDTSNPMRRIARFLIDSLLWCWTADGIDDTGEAGRDKLKYDCTYQLHTVDALARWEANGRRSTGLRHEHAVPRKVLLQCMIESPNIRSEVEIFDQLWELFC